MGILCAPLVSVEVKSSLISVDEKRIIEMVGICHYVFIIYWCVGNGNNHVTMVNRMNVNVKVNGGGMGIAMKVKEASMSQPEVGRMNAKRKRSN